MAIKIEKKIIGYTLKKPLEEVPEKPPERDDA